MNSIRVNPSPDDPGDSMQRRIRTGDVVLHRPTGGQWTVAYADYETGRLSWCGWPEGSAALADCELVAWCDDEEHRELLTELANMPGNDHRKRYAQKMLEAVS